MAVSSVVQREQNVLDNKVRMLIGIERWAINSDIYRTLKMLMMTSFSSCLKLSEESPLKYLVAWIFSAIKHRIINS